MDFIKFPVATTNIFPCANTTNGGQLVTEFNLRSRESVATDSNVSYMIGPSYVHGEADFAVSLMNASSQYFVDETPTSSTILKINEGSAVVNGHFIQSLVPITIDLVSANEEARVNGDAELTGHLSVGLRVMYSTEATMSGSILTESKDTQYADLYEGVQIVILPTTAFKTPSEVPDAQEQVTAHLLLATFDYFNGIVTNIQQNYPRKCAVMDASRISNVDAMLTDDYLRKSGLNYKKLYVFAGKGKNPDTGKDTWCDATDTMMVWDKTPTPMTDSEFVNNAVNQGLAIKSGTSSDAVKNLMNRYPEALFDTLSTDEVAMVVPHKEIDYPIHTSSGETQLYPLKVYKLPVADFVANTPGTVDRAYTEHVKSITQKINDLYHLTSGKQRCYVDVLNDRADLPALNQKWNVGDYILVGEDNTIDISNTEYTQPPSSMYVVIPGIVSAVKYIGSTKNLTTTSDEVAVGGGQVPPMGVLIQSLTQSDPPNITDASVYNAYFHFDENEYRGAYGVDYFAIDTPVIDESTGVQKIDKESGLSLFDRYYYVVDTSGKKSYTDPPIWLTDEIPLAQTDRIGGFLNVPDTATDAGYVIRDDEGHLRILDYSLLRSGTLAYQLGEDFETSSGLSISEIQAQLDEYVNYRVAFPNATQMHRIQNDGIPNEINVIIHLSAATDEEIASKSTTLTIRAIDSRFNTHVNLQILGSADSNVTINIEDCERIRIDTISGTPHVNLYRSCLYYDYTILDRLAQDTIEDMRLWYVMRKSTDPRLTVDYMTVREYDTPTISSGTDFYDTSTPNDNHFLYGLQSLTFSSDGTIVGCSMLVRNDSTSNVQEGKFIIGNSYVIPQGGALMYPQKLLRKQLKVTGQFISAYHIASPDKWVVQNTSFTALSQKYEVSTDGTAKTISGTITFLVDAFYVDNAQVLSGTGTDASDSIDGWEPSKFHIFSGGALS